MNALEDKYYTLDEYFALAEELDFKIEYHDGRIYALAGGSSNNSIIATNIRRRLSEKLDDTDCVVYDSDMQLMVEEENRYLYPDAMVVCGKREYGDEKKMTIKNPVLIIEVLSAATEVYDKTEKFRYCRSIPSFREYLLVHPEKVAVDAFYRADEQLWRISSATGLNESIHLYSLGDDLQIKDIYAKTEGLQEV